MPADEYWNGNPYLVVGYREAYELKLRERNQELWLQGRYIFDAIMISISNIHLDGKKHQINLYNKEPYDLFGKTEQEKKDEVNKIRQSVIDKFTALKKAWDKKGKK